MRTTTFPTLLDTLWHKKQPFPAKALRSLVVVIGGTIALWLSAKIHIPFYPVPLSMQTFVVLFLGAAFGWKLGSITLIVYLFEGAIGLPVFAGTPEKGIGIAYIIGPTGGYLIGFVFAAMATGWMAERGFDRNVWKAAIAMVVGNVIIYFFGVLWLGYVLGWHNPIFAWGVTPFVLGDALKIVLAALLLPSVWQFLGKKKVT